MAVTEVKAFFDVLSEPGAIVMNTSIAYYGAFPEIRTFLRQEADLKVKQTVWGRMPQSCTVPLGPMLDTLRRGKEMLDETLRRFDESQKGNCCFRFYKKVTLPSKMIANLDDVSKTFDEILQGMKEEQEATESQLLPVVCLLYQQANNRLAPFSFSMDDKYVPIMETVKDVETALAVETPSGTMYEESGRGKSTLAKYLALKFHQELNQGTSKFLGGIFLLVCQQNLGNTPLLMGKLWEDLSFGSQESDPMHLDTFLDLYKLIIIDNVWKQDVIKDLRIPYKHVKYLLTSQTNHLWSDVTARVTRVCEAEPSVEEVRQLLRKSSGTWTEDTPLDADAQIQVDGLINEVDRVPWCWQVWE